MESKWRKIWGLIGLLLLNFVNNVSSLSLTITKVDCVYEIVRSEGDIVSGNFVVVDHHIFWSSDHPGIDFSITSPGGGILHNLKGTSGDKFSFKAPRSGLYQFCFHNPLSTPETIAFYIHIGHIPNEHNLAKNEHLDPIIVKIAELREALEAVTTEQKYLKARDAVHRRNLMIRYLYLDAANESTKTRVIGYTVGEYILLTIASVLQVVYIRRLFSKSVGYNRI
ncbi:hypothetical protein ERO13_D01G022000v2 [Gossypium hirsutum]|uniref:Transmembrane emp24 domain-containing protein p24beta3 isoform X1 n=1 Tax=Gossypium hirsutum TaxID=3635 RepID=A0A1U8M1Q7_GOSHI|nr:transmembrane emp24 domain-containing protein p24beta3-like isoform X1 [Gossypium hirsutum]KAG4160810.1 hypothetical protein ERO13_D01G022000v2 [Gossypium hirsutum]